MQMPRMCGRKVDAALLMCRKIVIECEWDDEFPEDAASVFYGVENFNTLNPYFEHLLREFLTNRFHGQLTIRVEKLHG